MLENLVKKYISKDINILEVFGITFLMFVVFVFITIVMNDKSPHYIDCIEKATDNPDRSAEILSICKELK